MSLFDSASAVLFKKKAVKKISISGANVWEASGIRNLLPLATDTDRVTIYDGVGYRYGSRLNSSGEVVAGYGSQGMCATGFIPAQPGDVLRITGFDNASGTNYYVIAYDSSNTMTGCKNTTTARSPFALTLDEATFGSSFNAIRFNVRNLTSESIVTINQEIP